MIIVLFIIALAILILAHEFGHFLFAKLSGAKVEEFGLGFPPRLFGFKKGETVYSINAIPFGGFVKIFGENSNEKKPGSFGSRPIYMRAVILAAGVFFNIILAFVLFSAVYMIGAPMSVGDDVENGAVTILEVQKNTPAEEIGLRPGDKLLGFSTVQEVQEFISKNKGGEIEMEYLRGKDTFSAIVIPNPNPPEGIGSLGIVMDRIGIVRLPFYKAFWEGLKDTVFLTITLVKMFGILIADIFSGGDLAAQVRGPVGIVGMVGQAAEFGFVYVVQFIALLSINLAIINFIPFPALDGGRLLFLGIEAIKRSPVSQKVTNVANGVGFVLLIALMILITYKDIARLF